MEETIPAGLTPSNLTGPNANWNAGSRKISWYGTGSTVAALRYTVSSVAAGTYTVTGTANCDGGANVPVTGDNAFHIQPCHPADTNADWQMAMGEAIAYLAGWQQGVNTMSYAIRAAYLWQKGPRYERLAGLVEPMCWEVIAAPASFALKALSALDIGLQSVGGGAASRTITGTTVSIAVTPSAGTSAWGFEETIPVGLTPANLTGPNANWNATSRKISWYSTGAAAATLGYTVTGPDGAYTVAGTANFDGADSAVSGATEIVIGTPAQPVLSFTPASRSVAKEAGTTTFSVANTGSGTMTWTAAVTSGGTWARITSGASGTNSGTVTVAYDANPAGGAERTATIRVTASGATGSPVDVTVRQAPNDGGGTAVRTINGTTISIAVTPAAGTSAWGFEETIPAGLTPADLTGPNANWNATSRKITWYSTGAAAATLVYTVSGAAGKYTLAGAVNFDGVNGAVSGENQIAVATTQQYQVAIYGETAGFIPTQHVEFAENYRLDSWNGTAFDSNVGRFTAPEIDVICIGGDNAFSSATAQAIETAVHDDGKILLINFWSNRNFNDALPASNGGSALEGTTMTVVDPASPVFTGLPSVFTRQHSTDFNREFATPKAEATVLMEYADGSPALLYWRYGNGWVIEWTSEMMGGFFVGSQLDTINYRLLTMLLESGDRNVALQSNGGVASAGTVGTYLGESHPGSYANDGDLTTAWCNSWAMPDWLEVEFDRTYLIDRVGVVWGEGTHNQTFSISLSEDGSAWTTVVPSRASATDAGYNGSSYHGSTAVSRELFSITPTRARYIRIDVTGTSAPSSHIFQAIVHELQAFGNAVTQEVSYAVTYNDNGATGGAAPADQSKTNDVPLTLRTNSGNLVRTGYGFAGWNTQADGNGTDYAAGGTYTANASVTLYAKWTPTTPPVLSVTPDSQREPNGGGTTTFSVTNVGGGTITWTAAVVSGGSWARITSGASGNNAGTVTVGYDANPAGNGARKMTIRVTAAGATNSPVDVIVRQAANWINTGGSWMSDWAWGAFNGVGWESGGSASMSVTSAGKITGKLIFGGKTYSFSAPSYTSGNAMDGYEVETVAKSGSVSLPIYLYVNAPGMWDDTGVFPRTLGVVQIGVGVSEDEERWFTLYRNVWKDSGMAATLSPFVGYYTASLPTDGAGSGYLTLTVNKNGLAKVAGKLSDGVSVSASVPVVIEEEEARIVIPVSLSPSVYKGGFVILGIELTRSNGGKPFLRSYYNNLQVNLNPQACEYYGEGFISELSVVGGWYDKTFNLYSHYAGGLTVGDTGLPMLPVSVKFTDWNDDSRKISWTEGDYAGAAEIASPAGVLVELNGAGTGFVAPKADKPVRDPETGEYYYDDTNGDGVNNTSGLTFSFTKATGLFKGTFKTWYDYVSAEDFTTEKTTLKHTSKTITYQGVVTPVRENMGDGVAGRGYFLWADTGFYENDAGKVLSYKFNWSYGFLLMEQ